MAIHEPATDIRYDNGVEAVLIADPSTFLSSRDAGSDRLATAFTALGGRMVGRIGWHDSLERQPVPRVVLVDAAGIEPGTIAERLGAIVAWAAGDRAALVIALAPEQIDAIAEVTLGGGTALLVNPGIGECVGAVAQAIELARGPDGVFDINRESDSARLERLNVEVSRIAEALARLTRTELESDRRPPSIVGDRVDRYGAPPAIPSHGAPEIRRAIRTRRMRDQFFTKTLFEDPGWDMLLDLYAAELESRRVSVSSLCIASAVAATTALRWIARMTDDGLFERERDPHDRRRAYMALSSQARAAMHGYMTSVLREELRIA